MSTTDPALAVFTPLDPAFRADPYPFYEALRQHDPVHRVGDTVVLMFFTQGWAVIGGDGAVVA